MNNHFKYIALKIFVNKKTPQSFNFFFTPRKQNLQQSHTHINMAKEIPLETVKQHNKPNDLWVIIEDKVYDLTKFRSEHPGGEQTLDDVAGRDGTRNFMDVGHSADAKKMMKKYYIGDLASKDRKKNPPLREIGICVVSFVIGVAAVILIKQLLIKK